MSVSFPISDDILSYEQWFLQAGRVTECALAEKKEYCVHGLKRPQHFVLAFDIFSDTHVRTSS